MTFDELFLKNTAETSATDSLPLFKETAIDFATCETLAKNGEIITLEGAEALRVWVFKALKTERFKYSGHSDSYGNSLHEELGYIYDRTIKQQLIQSEIEECLIVNPYITRVYDFQDDFDNDNLKLTLQFKIDTVYGTINQEVVNIGI